MHEISVDWVVSVRRIMDLFLSLCVYVSLCLSVSVCVCVCVWMCGCTAVHPSMHHILTRTALIPWLMRGYYLFLSHLDRSSPVRLDNRSWICLCGRARGSRQPV
jgi:hypothetical protein